jgi:mannose-6-phosphate isomerase-like protein (cupin superfamily)
VIPPGASIGSRALPDFAEVYYVISGEGTITVGSEKAKIGKDDVIPVKLNEARSIQNTGTAPMEFLIVGVAKDMAAKDALMAHPSKP